jgi:hypothetical protein
MTTPPGHPNPVYIFVNVMSTIFCDFLPISGEQNGVFLKKQYFDVFSLPKKQYFESKTPKFSAKISKKKIRTSLVDLIGILFCSRNKVSLMQFRRWEKAQNLSTLFPIFFAICNFVNPIFVAPCQGDQIGQIFASWAIAYFKIFF